MMWGLSSLGCRPFSAENCPLDSFPGASNPPNPFGMLRKKRYKMSADSVQGIRAVLFG